MSSFAPKKIFLPLDFAQGEDKDAEALSNAALDAAMSLAGRFEAKLLVASSLPPLLGVGGPDFAGEAAMALEQVAKLQHEQVEKALFAAVERLKESGIDAEAHIAIGDEGVAQSLVNKAEKLEADLIVLPSHGRMGLKRFFLGSVAERVAHLAKVPVLLLKPHLPE